MPAHATPRERALAQTYTNIEIVVSDNGPTEAVARLVMSVGDARVRYRHNGGNIGAMRNALAAYREARGTYVATLHDDVWEPTFLERLVPPLEADADLAGVETD
jgi:glycosyltransferase involved in cell wall biosynthesis